MAAASDATRRAGTGAATGVAGVDGWIQEISLTFGLCITVLAYTIGGRSGGHINGAVTVGPAPRGRHRGGREGRVQHARGVELPATFSS